VLLCALLTGCAATTPQPAPTKPTPGPGETRTTLGADKVGIIVPPHPNGTLLIAVHGHGGTVDEWLAGETQAGVRQALLSAGYTIAASDGAGNAWGNTQSVKAYEDLYAWAEQLTGFSDVVLLGQSMGGLPALQLVGKIPATKFVGIYPVCDLASMTDKFPTFREAWPGGAPASLSPVKPDYPPGFRALFFASPADTTVPKATNTDVCAAGARAAGADVSVLEVQGEHGDPSAFQPARVVEFLKGT
jgi:pimeloyl-ACP methyl ester carboxylesterase